MTATPTQRAELKEWAESGLAKKWREDAGLSPEQAALKLKVSVRSLYRWEADEATPDGYRFAAYYSFLKRVRPKDFEQAGTRT